MKQHQYREVVRECLEKESAFCTAACPFHLDVRDFVTKLSRGAFSMAYKTYRNAVGFPRIVSALCDRRCKAVCPREALDAAPDMVLLEKAAVAFAGNTAPNRYNMPAKKQRVAVVGAGPNGLACALRLASRKYEVTVFERSGRIGGRLWDVLSPALFLADIEEQFANESYTLALDRAIKTLDELEGFDAVYIATGRGGESFGLSQDRGGAFASGRPGFFLGGSLTGAEGVGAIAEGLFAVHAIERYLKTGAMNHPRESSLTRVKLDPSALSPAQPVLPAEGAAYTREEASAEAARCMRCACDACQRRCDLMRYYKKFPERICDEVAITVDPASLDGEETFAKRLMGTCNQCGACADACPEHIDMGAFLLESRRAMHRKGKLPWAFHDFWLRDMGHAQGERAALARAPKGADTAAYAFFPGCQLGASDPAYVTESYRYLLSALPGTALWLSCCGAPAVWSGDEKRSDAAFAALRGQWEALGKPVPVFACTTCKQMFGRYLPEAGGVFLYDIMDREGFRPKRAMGGRAYSVFDPCTGRMEEALHSSVRALAAGAGAALSPLADEGRRARCCSWGGHVSIANPDYAESVVQKRIGQSDLPYITYCVNCRDVFADAGKGAVHILDILFDLNGEDRAAPGCNRRRENREALRRMALREFWDEEEAAVPENEETAMKLHIDDELHKKLAEALILEEDVRQTVTRCEAEGRTVADGAAGSRIGYAVIGRITYWAEYRKIADGEYRLINAYSHRMAIDLEETWHGRKTKTDL